MYPYCVRPVRVKVHRGLSEEKRRRRGDLHVFRVFWRLFKIVADLSKLRSFCRFRERQKTFVLRWASFPESHVYHLHWSGSKTIANYFEDKFLLIDFYPFTFRTSTTYLVPSSLEVAKLYVPPIYMRKFPHSCHKQPRYIAHKIKHPYALGPLFVSWHHPH